MHQLMHRHWDDALLRNALTLRESVEALPEEPPHDHDWVQHLRQTLDALEAEVMHRGLGEVYLYTIISKTHT